MLVVATGNRGKLEEFRKILPEYQIVSMGEVGFSEDIEENGSTFEENALIKARTVMKKTGMTAIADDSGLCVDALGGAPGIYSARYAGENATDCDLVKKLLSEMQNVPKEERGAEFVSVIAFVTPHGEEKTFRGVCRGYIDFTPAGDKGFGYDPVFVVPQYGKTFAQLEMEEKNAISHRGRALELFRAYMDVM